ncbi:NAD-dependent epimerase/dehydratase family protein [Candidatus Peregrinibacteria bacterium]|jgi:nucleoside-diphosphate-sugar epimerase|nr:NAD-dependent epimerase/dehydratase family protein [Candidatus Peregrinibacteria bacterium]MBT7483884.1 NAD-dependent epimerase/dehydratase family protein [Candidatus Peregrinibacteria bacterium]MBT7702681.1 NAD-dependent epimerase/dehydratase family protein [Candidatus Peregrinibacteria bacterium]
MKILITGSSGMIGTSLMERLLGLEHEVVGLDFVKNEWNESLNDKTLDVDLRDLEATLQAVPADIDIVVHLAANARVYDLVVEPQLAMDNMLTVFNILETVRQKKIPKLCFASSREVYGNSEKEIHNEDESYVKNCESPYTASKITGEALVHSYSQCYGLEFLIYRFSNVYGKYDQSDRVIPLFIRKLQKNEPIVVFGKDKLLDFTYIDDTVSGIVSSLERFDEVKNRVFNLAFGKGTSILFLAERLKELLKSESEISVEESRIGEVIRFIADVAQAKEALDYDPQVGIEEGLKKSLEWYLK